MRATCLNHLIHRDFFTLIFVEDYELLETILRNSLHSRVLLSSCFIHSSYNPVLTRKQPVFVSYAKKPTVTPIQNNGQTFIFDSRIYVSRYVTGG